MTISNRFLGAGFAATLLLCSSSLLAADSPAPVTVTASAITPAMQTVLDAQKKVIVAWAADPAVVAAVKAQNAKGPIAGMDNAKWKALATTDAVVVAFQKNPAGVLLTTKLKDSTGLLTEAFLNGAKGEKVAFAAKTTSYLHAGTPKFDVPMSGKAWQGTPEIDESTKLHSIQISTPVLDGGKPIGVLVVGVSMEKLAAAK